MKLHDDYYEEEHGSGSKITYAYMILIMSVVILGVTALVFYVNQSNDKSDGSGYAAAVAQKEAKEAAASQTAQDANEVSNSSSKLTSDQLDIWTLPDTGRTKTGSSSNSGTVTNKSTGETVSEGSSDSSSDESRMTADEAVDGRTTVYDATQKESEAAESSSEDDDKATSITVKLSDGTKEEVELSDDIERNSYDYSSLTSKSPLMTYSEDGTVVSKCGVDINASLGEVDFSKLKNAGIDFVMIKIGARGYSSGNIVMDANYEDNLAAAKKAGLGIGVYFCSQAVTKAEAREEADVVLDAIERYSIKYPVAYVMENVTDDMARIEALDTSDKTSMAKAFMDRIENSGYTPILYGDLEWLMTNVDMSKLTDYDVWYAQDGSKPDYPYQFTMWQYSSNATVKGIDSKAAMILSFKDYSK